ncbi:effector-associated domain EAD1-containing protein [Pseudosporangium ferrugineum]|uniref:Uncharacterized protein n=1 Tax=Pseudosporangium ferrugineum TaxID=439699 RepID=A0A2T0RFJ6_9ACTN|nr:effector-associated domain EAD1-containing protein [Pseudosporangium ferrugineum]PRY19984.1 hypothetical protein CLV70_12622 [Pseudosporangium ferrugineum]
MNAAIHLARFGNRGGAHTLLSHTGAPDDLAGRIIWHTDAPPQSSDAVVDGFVAGYRLDNMYIVQVTQPDETASRPGMVATTAAIIPVELLANIDLLALFAQLNDADIDLTRPLSAIPFAARHTHPAGASALGSAVLVEGRAAWLGVGLGDAIGCLWRHASVGDRIRMVFGAAFHPEAIPVPINNDSIVVVKIPDRARSRWSDWRTVGVASPVMVDLARDAFFGDDGGRASGLAHNLEVGGVRLAHWRYLAIAAELLESVQSLDHESVRSLLQLLGLLQPSPRKGAVPKRTALARLADITPTARFPDIRGLRGIPWNSFVSSISLKDILRSWAIDTILDPSRRSDFAEAATDIASNPDDEVTIALAAGLREAVDRSSLPTAIDAVLSYAHSPAPFSWLVNYAGSGAALDTEVARAVNEAAVVPGWVASAAAKHKLPLTHAMTVDVAEPVTAWAAQMDISIRVPSAEDVLARRIGSAGVVDLALELLDPGLVDRAGRLIVGEPSLLSGGDAADDAFRCVWASAVRHGADPWDLAPLDTAAEVLLSRVASDEAVDPVLLDALSRTHAADISQHPQRAALWNRMPPDIERRFKAVTAAAVARSFRPGDPVPEPQLQGAILAPEVIGSTAHDDAAQALALLRELPFARPEHAALVARRGRFSREDAIGLAILIVDRRWKRAAETVVDLAATRSDLRLVAGRVAQLFNPLERLRRLMGISDGVDDFTTADDFRDAVHDIAVDLYAEGPTVGGLWERAGGRDADLPKARTGRLRWGLALHAVMQGQRGAPKMKDLLDEMVIDYPKNRDLHAVVASLGKRKKK